MHDLLKPGNLSRLSPKYQALAHASFNGSIPDFAQLRAYVVTPPGISPEWIHCLPIPFALLHPARIPRAPNRDIHNVDLAVEALTFLRTTHRPEAPAWPDLWPRAWAWIDFLHAHRKSYTPHSREPIWRFLLRLVGVWVTHPPTAQLIRNTAGVRRIIIYAWKAIIDSTPTFEPENLFVTLQLQYLSEFFRHVMDLKVAANFAEVIDEAGGLAGFASLVTRTIKFCIPGLREAYSIPQNSAFFVQFLSLMIEFEDVDSIHSALVSTGIVPVFTSALKAFSLSMANDPPANLCEKNNILCMFKILQDLLYVSPSSKSIADALGSGLLSAIVSAVVICKDFDKTHLESSPLCFLLANTLPTSTVYHSVVSVMNETLSKTHTIAMLSSSFKKSHLCNWWHFFVNLAEERIRIMKRIESKEEDSKKACYNLECGLIEKKEEFRRCSQCLYAYYCSRECQKQDWKDGGHREACPSIRQFRQKHHDLSPRSSSFLRAVVHQEDEHDRSDGIPSMAFRLAPMKENPPDNPLVVVFDHTGIGLFTKASTAREEREKDVNGEVLWDEHISRVQRSRGRMELHLIMVRDGKRKRRYMFPQRSKHSVVQDRLSDAAKRPDASLHDAVDAMFEERKKGEAIHE
ncbi:MYND-type domain-containing protein [Favolaschia claudopus]|uniref:MYND-type domain-containing protein n=1 Tax=Favolaschia claudopus TaxID=2862362 RepID=A0AAW0CA19_9AGAR